MGKIDKEHRKKVKARNERIKHDFKRASKIAWEKFEEWKKTNGDKDTDNKSISGFNISR